MISENSQALAQKLLWQIQGRSTPVRLGVLSILLEAKAALNQQELEHEAARTGLIADRVTLYRTLDWLVTQGIAHRISSNDRTWRYKAQAEYTTPHAHFQCKQCGQVFCLEGLQPSLLFKLPTGYQLEELELKLQGYCPDCSNSHAT